MIRLVFLPFFRFFFFQLVVNKRYMQSFIIDPVYMNIVIFHIVVKAQNPQPHLVSSQGMYIKLKNSEDLAKKLKHTGSTSFYAF
jgi:hypothetical protein